MAAWYCRPRSRFSCSSRGALRIERGELYLRPCQRELPAPASPLNARVRGTFVVRRRLSSRHALFERRVARRAFTPRWLRREAHRTQQPSLARKTSAVRATGALPSLHARRAARLIGWLVRSHLGEFTRRARDIRGLLGAHLPRSSAVAGARATFTTRAQLVGDRRATLITSWPRCRTSCRPAPGAPRPSGRSENPSSGASAPPRPRRIAAR